MKNEQRITLRLAGKEYPLTLTANDKQSLAEVEEMYRLAEREVNTLYTGFEKAQYVEYNSVRDYLALAALSLAIEKVKQRKSTTLADGETTKLGALVAEIETYLNKAI